MGIYSVDVTSSFSYICLMKSQSICYLFWAKITTCCITWTYLMHGILVLFTISPIWWECHTVKMDFTTEKWSAVFKRWKYHWVSFMLYSIELLAVWHWCLQGVRPEIRAETTSRTIVDFYIKFVIQLNIHKLNEKSVLLRLSKRSASCLVM